jgi:hypothetical protein
MVVCSVIYASAAFPNCLDQVVKNIDFNSRRTKPNYTLALNQRMTQDPD